MKKKKLLGLSLVTLILFNQVSTPTTAIAISSEAAQTIEASKKIAKTTEATSHQKAVPTTSPSVAAEVTSLSANESASITPSATSDASTDSRATEVTTNSEEKTENSDSNTVTAAQDWVQVDDVEFSYQWDEATGSLEITPSDPLATTAQLLEAISQITTFEQVRQLTVPVQQELKTEGASLAQLTNLEELNMPDVLSVGDLTLNGSTGGFQHLKKIQMDKVTTLGNYNVAALPALENIKYSRLEEVGKGCFSDLANFVGDSYGFILSRTTRIGDECFNNLPKIKVVVLPMLVQAGANSFCQLANLEILAFSDLQSVGSQSFNDLPKLKLVELRGWYERPERPIFDVLKKIFEDSSCGLVNRTDVLGVAISEEVTVTAIEGDICDITTASYAYVNKETANVIPKVTVTAASDSSNTITNPMGPLRLSDSGDHSVSLKIYDSVTNEQLQMAGFYFSSVTLNVEAPIEASAKAQELLMGTKSSEVDPKQFVQDVKMGETTLDPDKYTAQFVEPFEVNQVAQTVKVQVASTKNAENATIINVPIKGLWGNSIAFGGSYVNDITEAVATFTLQPADVPQITATYQYPDGEALIHGAGAFDGETYYSFDVFSMAGNERLVMPSVGELGDQRFAAKGNEPVNVIDQWGQQPVAYGDIVRSYVVEPSRHWAVYGDEKVVKPYQPTKNSVVPKNSVFYEITENGYQPLAINYADISHNDGQALMISTATTNQELDAQLSKIMNIQGMPEDTEVKFLSYPSREKGGDRYPGCRTNIRKATLRQKVFLQL